MDKCPFCETRKALRQAEKLLDKTPMINSKHYDDAIADLINSLGDAYSLFMCYCPDELPFADTSAIDPDADSARFHGQEAAV